VGIVDDNKTIAWFSCGAASAVATKLLLQENPNIEIIYQDTGSEHPDNIRFLKDCEKWFGKKILILKSDKYTDIWDVFSKTKYLVGPSGARCTTELKKLVARRYIEFGDVEYFGYTIEEKHRVARFKEHNPERMIRTILIEKWLTKDDCLGMLKKAGIEIPVMYTLGFLNNNCIGCPKGGMGYWNLIREHFPSVFNRMASVERDIGISIIRKETKHGRVSIYLDELEPNAGNILKEPNISCGLMCEIESIKLKVA
jgi:hypothetical protein